MDIVAELSYRLPIEVFEIVYYRKAEISFPVCPKCNIAIEREYQTYCDRCGQYLSWNRFENRAKIIITLK